MRQHNFEIQLNWTGNEVSGTSAYTKYSRAHLISIEGKKSIEGSSDAAFRGDASKHSPEDMFLASISSCHMLWYLHLCSDAGVIVTSYLDNAIGVMVEDKNGGGRFTSVTLRPSVTVSEASMINKALAMHIKANELCFIANSCNFPIRHEAICRAQ